MIYVPAKQTRSGEISKTLCKDGSRFCSGIQGVKWPLILWLLGVVTAVTFGGLIHILLVVAIIVSIIRLVQRRKVL